jgi:ferredoxin
MVKLNIDNQPVEIEEGATVLDAARKLGIDIPTLCAWPGCTPNTSCLVCVVRVNGGKRLLPSCATKVAEGMAIESETKEIHESRRMALELLLADHAGDCFAPCTNVCPAHMDIPTMIRQIEAGELRDAIITVKRHIALPAVLGRICPELCEKGCRRGAKDEPVNICRLKRHVADVDLASEQPYMPECLAASGKSVAIVGTGPTGLAAAYYLLQRGHRCVLYDGKPKAGGNLRYAIDDEKLPKSVLDEEIAVIEKLGATFRLGVALGKDVSLQQLRDQFDAVLLAVGELDAAKAKAMGIDFAGRGIKTDRKTMLTPVPGVFAAGAAVTPFKHAIRACAEGRCAAGVIDRLLRGEQFEVAPHAFTVRLGVLTPVEQHAIQAGSNDVSRNATTNLHDFSLDEAHDESTRCLSCDCSKLHACRLRDTSIRYDADPARYKVDRRPYERTTSHPSLTHEAGKCIACGLCVQIAQRDLEPLGLTHVGRGFRVRIAVPFDDPISTAMRNTAKACADACPTAALTWLGNPD